MIRLTKFADYGMLLMGQIAARQDQALSAHVLADETGVPGPTVSKLLGKFAKGGLLISHRGAQGGFTLARSAHDISVADIVQAVEGPIALTQCIEHGLGACGYETQCPSRMGWSRVNAAIRGALEGITLAEMITPLAFKEGDFREDGPALNRQEASTA